MLPSDIVTRRRAGWRTVPMTLRVTKGDENLMLKVGQALSPANRPKAGISFREMLRFSTVLI